DVHLEQVPQVVHARTALAEPALLLDRRRLRIALRDDEAPQLVAELAGDLLPDRLAEEVAEPDAAIVDRIGKEDPPPVLRQLHVLEVRPAGWIHADRGADVDLVVVLEALRAHVLPPLDVLRLPVLEGALQPLVARQADVVRNLLSGNHEDLTSSTPNSKRQTPTAQLQLGRILKFEVGSLKFAVMFY